MTTEQVLGNRKTYWLDGAGRIWVRNGKTRVFMCFDCPRGDGVLVHSGSQRHLPRDGCTSRHSVANPALAGECCV
jgi:hypothetical protein